MSSIELGTWGVIDIETTGVDAQTDDIIDIGLLIFDNFKIKQRYNSLVKTSKKLSPLITKLTGITDNDLLNAPSWDEVKDELNFLNDGNIVLFAHNAKFESSFLKKEFPQVVFVDSIPFFSLLHPKKSRLSLESLIVELKIKDKEEHRGLSDALDLLKVWIISLIKTSIEKKIMLQTLALKFQINSDYVQLNWPLLWMNCKKDHLVELLTSIDFNYFEYENRINNELTEEKIINDTHLKLDEKDKIRPEFSGEVIKQIFQNQELIQSLHPKYEYRASQEQMSLRIGQSFKNRIHALIQAPTGTGKTLSYLIPSIIFTKTQKESVLISTGTKSLQNQMMVKDIPLAQNIIKNALDEKNIDCSDLKIVQLMGSNNHLCELMWQKILEEEGADVQKQIALFENKKDKDRSYLEKFSWLYFDYLFYLNGHFNYNEKITRNDIPFVLKKEFSKLSEVEKEISVDFRSCSGQICPLKENCSYFLGLREAQKADIIVGNHALTFTWPKGIKRPEYIIFDEAHRIEEETTSAFSLKVEEKDLLEINNQLLNLQGVGALFYLLQKRDGGFKKIDEIKNSITEIQKILSDELVDLSENIESIFLKLKNYQSQYWNEILMFDYDLLSSGSIEQKAYFNIFKVKEQLEKIDKLLTPYLQEWDVTKFDFKKEKNEIMSYTRFEVFILKLSDIVTTLSLLIQNKKTREDNRLGVIKFLKESGYSFFVQPIDIGIINWQQLLLPSGSVIFTSATLSVMNELGGVKGTEWATGYMYVDPLKRFKTGLYLPPVYDYNKNARVVLSHDVPPLNDVSFVATIIEGMIPIVEKLKGRTLLLFSAKTRFDKAVTLLLEKFNGTIPLFIQGMGSNIVEEFKKSPWGILIGMESFGEGIDVPGDQISFIFIDKIPDLRQDLIIEARRKFFEEKFGNEFLEYYLSYRAKNLQQKLGRLLRTNSDRGGVLIVDSRIKKWKTRTINQFLNLLKPYDVKINKFSDALIEIEKFIINEN